MKHYRQRKQSSDELLKQSGKLMEVTHAFLRKHNSFVQGVCLVNALQMSNRSTREVVDHVRLFLHIFVRGSMTKSLNCTFLWVSNIIALFNGADCPWTLPEWSSIVSSISRSWILRRSRIRHRRRWASVSVAFTSNSRVPFTLPGHSFQQSWRRHSCHSNTVFI